MAGVSGASARRVGDRREVRHGRADLVGRFRHRRAAPRRAAPLRDARAQTAACRPKPCQSGLGDDAAVERHLVFVSGQNSDGPFELLQRSAVGRHAERLAGIGSSHLFRSLTSGSRHESTKATAATGTADRNTVCSHNSRDLCVHRDLRSVAWWCRFASKRCSHRGRRGRGDRNGGRGCKPCFRDE